ncbi:Rrf2 family transcriptional regulator [Pedobacter sp. BS3]|uniref:RrF2 family transcriptional regulator n=1 Tax=Pedobacter sp. BS3 TaxID=2567937 RepID=UPI0011EDF340|nr:Rrf2 family transcriptional regulator [Pedobacter sp. BS3]TZF84804.1 Rrf2 family transcriptional regulator [Pedobacter sp. BS3]
MLSYTCKTAIKAVIYLATKSSSEGKSAIKEIAEYIQASEHTVGKILQTLVKQGVINSLKGPTGGFFMSEKQRQQPIMTIIEAIDGRQVFQECGLGLHECSSVRPCPIHYEYKEARDRIETLFKTKHIADLCEPVNNGLAYLYT